MLALQHVVKYALPLDELRKTKGEDILNKILQMKQDYKNKLGLSSVTVTHVYKIPLGI